MNFFFLMCRFVLHLAVRETEPKRLLKLYLTGQMQKEMTPNKGPVHYNKWFNNLESSATIVKSAKSKDEDVKKLPTGPHRAKFVVK